MCNRCTKELLFFVQLDVSVINLFKEQDPVALPGLPLCTGNKKKTFGSLAVIAVGIVMHHSQL